MLTSFLAGKKNIPGVAECRSPGGEGNRKIILLQRLLPIYREQLFERLRREFARIKWDFEFWHSKATGGFSRRGTEGNLPWSELFPVRRILGPLNLEWQSLSWRRVFASDVMIVSDNLRVVSNVVVLLLRRIAGKVTLTWGHGVNFQPEFISRVFSILRFRLLRLATAHLVYTDACVAPMVAAGFDRTRISVVGNAIDTSESEALYVSHPSVLAFRKRYGLQSAPCVVFLGSWYARKRPELIISVGEAIRARVPNAYMLVIGGGDGLAGISKMDLPWLKVLGPLQGRDKYVALCSARCLAITGVGGLNIIDAMAVGLPVVVPQRNDHSPEIVYVQQGVNGCIVSDNAQELANACARLCLDDEFWQRMSVGARRTVSALSLDTVVDKILSSAKAAAPHTVAPGELNQQLVVVVYQRMLPYHWVRFNALQRALVAQGKRCMAVEVASVDGSYGAIGDTCDFSLELDTTSGNYICLFPGIDYLTLQPREVASAVYRVLNSLSPSVVFTPAPAFSEGAGALHYKVRNGGKLVLMDDAWTLTDRRGPLTRMVKRLLYGFFDGGFFPSPLHGKYFERLNVPCARQSYALDVVGASAGAGPDDVLDIFYDGQPYLLFVGRLIERKGLSIVLRALAGLGDAAPKLYVIGDGPCRKKLEAMALELGLAERVQWLGSLGNQLARRWMHHAAAVLVPSEFEQWGLVVNEAWMAETLVLGSDSVGALRAAEAPELAWMKLPVGCVASWQAAISRLLALSAEQRANLLDVCRESLVPFTLQNHVKSALTLMELPARAKPFFGVGLGARLWMGRVAVW